MMNVTMLGVTMLSARHAFSFVLSVNRSIVIYFECCNRALSIVMLGVAMLFVIYADCHDECHYDECHYDERHLL